MAFNAPKFPHHSAPVLLEEFDYHYQTLRSAEKALYALPDRHLGGADVRQAEALLNHAREAFLDRMPKVFDPFAGGGHYKERAKYLSLLRSLASASDIFYPCYAPPERGSPVRRQHGIPMERNFTNLFSQINFLQV